MAPRIDGCPNEIIETIVVLLDLADISSLRLTSRSLAVTCTQDHFKSFFRKKSVDLTESGLTSFVEATKAGNLGCLIDDLTITGVVNNPKGLEAKLRKKTRAVTERHGPMFSMTEVKCTPDELVKAEQDLETLRQRQATHERMNQDGRSTELLAAAFRNLAENGKTGKLKRLSLNVIVYREDAEERLVPARGGAWKMVWECAAQTYRTSFAALAASSLEIESLVLFNDDTSRRCSIARNEIGTANFTARGMAESLSALKSLSLSLSNRLVDETDQDATRTGDPGDDIDWSVESQPRSSEVLRAEAGDESNFSGLAELLSACDSLRDLHLHSYGLSGRALRYEDWRSEQLLAGAVDAIRGRTTGLVTCRLRGLSVREQDLLALVQSSPIKTFVLENVRLDQGSFESIFDHCTSAEAGVQNLFLDDLFQQSLLVYFDTEGGSPKFPSSQRSYGSNTLRREGDDVRRPIEYHFTTGRMLGSPQAYNWRERMRAEYGPPQ